MQQQPDQDASATNQIVLLESPKSGPRAGRRQVPKSLSSSKLAAIIRSAGGRQRPVLLLSRQLDCAPDSSSSSGLSDSDSDQEPPMGARPESECRVGQGPTCHLLTVQAPITRTFSASALGRARSSTGSATGSPHRFSFWDSLVGSSNGARGEQPAEAGQSQLLLSPRPKW